MEEAIKAYALSLTGPPAEAPLETAIKAYTHSLIATPTTTPRETANRRTELANPHGRDEGETSKPRPGKRPRRPTKFEAAAATREEKEVLAQKERSTKRTQRGASRTLQADGAAALGENIPEHLRSALPYMLLKYRREATWENYGDYIEQFMKFARTSEGVAADPDNKDAVDAFFVHLFNRGKHPTILQARKAFRFRWSLTQPGHREFGVVSDIAMGASSRTHRVQVKHALTMRAETVKSIVDGWGEADQPTWKRMVATAILVQFACSLRHFGLSKILMQLIWDEDLGKMAAVYITKTSDNVILIPIGKTTGKYCPATKIEALARETNFESGPLLRKLLLPRAGLRRAKVKTVTFADTVEGFYEPMTHGQYSSLLSYALEECAGWERAHAKAATPHSLRRSGISAMARAGQPDPGATIAPPGSEREETERLADSQIPATMKRGSIPGFLRRANAGHAEPGTAAYSCSDSYIEQIWDMRMRIPKLLGL